MKESWDYMGCVSVLAGEIALLKQISDAHDRVRKAVVNREWTGFDNKMDDLNRMGSEFALLEDERARLFSALAKSTGGSGPAGKQAGGKPFYAAVAGLPWEQRRELEHLYGGLKTETLKLRARNETFCSYLNEVKTIAAAYIEAVCPARSGKLYTRKGGRVSQDLRSMVLNGRF